MKKNVCMKMSGLKPGARESGTLDDHQPGTKKQQDLRESWIILSEEDPLMALSL